MTPEPEADVTRDSSRVFPWPRVQAGDRVAVVAASGPVDIAALERGCDVLRGWQLEPVLGPALQRFVERSNAPLVRTEPRSEMLAAPDSERAEELLWALTAPDIHAVIAARGGYGLLRMLDQLRWDVIRHSPPRAVVGFSDVTCLHEAFRVRLDRPSLLGPHVAGLLGAEGRDVEGFPGAVSISSLETSLFRPERDLSAVIDGARILQAGVADAPFHGGNLATLAALTGSIDGTAPQRPFVAVIEDVNEAPYRVDRMLTQLVRAGWFAHAVGVVGGSWRGCGSIAAIDEIISERLRFVDGPIVNGARFGHAGEHLVVPLGISMTLDATMDARCLRIPAQ